jgi:Mn2+/Fe2+ NRAMP family transporter
MRTGRRVRRHRGHVHEHRASRLRRALHVLGPGLISGAADDDPAGIVVDSQAGAAYGYTLLWTGAYQAPLMSAVQLLAARIAIVTGLDLPRLIARRFSRWVIAVVALLVAFANTVTVGADLAGVGLGFRLLTHASRVPFEIITAIGIVLVVVFAKYWSIRRVLRWLTVLLFVYVVSAVAAKPDWLQVLWHTLIPEFHWNRDFATMWVAVFGTTVSPYVFIWQSAEEIEEHPREDEARRLQRDLKWMTYDTIIGMTISQIIEYSITLAAAATLFPAGIRSPQTGREIALALQPIAGGRGTILFAFGLIVTGVLAIPTLLGASAYCVAAVFHKPASLNDKPDAARTFYACLIVGAALGLILDLAGIPAVTLLFASGVVNGLLAPPLLIVMLIVANDRQLMGRHRASAPVNVLAGVTTVLMTVAGGFVAVSWLFDRFAR